MKKMISLILAFLLLAMFVSAVGPVRKAEVIPYYNGETLYRLWTGDGGFQLWITGNRELHCVYKLAGQNDGEGWSGPSTWMKYDYAHGGDGLDYMYKCEPI